MTSLKQEQGHLKDRVALRKVFETDVQKVDRWCKETEISCSTEPNLECAIEVLQEQCKHYKVDVFSVIYFVNSWLQHIIGIDPYYGISVAENIFLIKNYLL